MCYLFLSFFHLFNNRFFFSRIEKTNAIFHIQIDGIAACTAFAISDDYAITAAHCVSTTGLLSTINAYDINQKPLNNVKVLSFNEQTDLALLSGNFNNIDHLIIEVKTAEAAYSKSLIICGFPYNSKYLLCSPFDTIGINTFMVIGKNCAMYPGMSGGIAINPSTGHVVAVNRGVGDAISYLAPLVGALKILGIEK